MIPVLYNIHPMAWQHEEYPLMNNIYPWFYLCQEPVSSVPKLDLAFKAGQTIKVNINMNKDNDNNKASKPKAR